jgi:hypothetical protein
VMPFLLALRTPALALMGLGGLLHREVVTARV